MRGFRVIQGGREDASAPVGPSAGEERAPAPASSPGDALRIELHRAATVDDGAVAAWRALLVRNAVDDPRADPDYLLSAARHQARGERIVFALAWNRDGAGGEALDGVVPLHLPDPVWGRGAARTWRPHGAPEAGEAVIEGGFAEAVEVAIRRRLAVLHRPLRVDRPTRAQGGGAPRPVVVASRPAGGRRPLPVDSLVGIRAVDDVAGTAVEHVSDPSRIPAAVEQFLALDARSAPAPIIADPSEASMVRVVSRLFARRGQMRVELARRADQVVSGALHLGAGARAVVWRRAALR